MRHIADPWALTRTMSRQAMAGAVAALLLAGGCGRVEERGQGGVPPEVTVVAVVPVDVPVSIEQVGQTQASESVEIRSRVQGFLTSKSFAEGKRVEANQVLFEIDSKPFRADLEIAQARLAQAEARVARAERESRRISELVAESAGSRKELEDAQTELLQARADARAYAATVARAELDLSYTTIRSPFAGTVSESYKSVGALVDAGQNSLLAKVTQLDPINVSLTISEQEGLALQRDLKAGKVSLPEGRKAKVTAVLVDGTEYDHAGEIDFIAPEIDPTTGLARLRAKLPNPEGRLTAGQFVRVKLGGFVRRGAIRVPARCVLQSPAGQSVYVVGSDGKVAPKAVKVGAWMGDEWVIEGGLAAGDRVVVDGAQKVRPGMQVAVAQVGASTQPAVASLGN